MSFLIKTTLLTFLGRYSFCLFLKFAAKSVHQFFFFIVFLHSFKWIYYHSSSVLLLDECFASWWFLKKAWRISCLLILTIIYSNSFKRLIVYLPFHQKETWYGIHSQKMDEIWIAAPDLGTGDLEPLVSTFRPWVALGWGQVAHWFGIWHLELHCLSSVSLLCLLRQVSYSLFYV